MSRFLNRAEAGKALAEAVADKHYDDPVILALPRGGVPVAIELVRVLKAPLDLVMVRKIGAPGQQELAVAAVVNGDDPQIVVNEGIMAVFGLTDEDIEQMSKSRLDEIRRRREVYLGGRPQVPVKGRTAVVVDDGIATGATTRASLKAVRKRDPARLVLAVPVGPADVVEELRDEVDEVICLSTPSPFQAIGLHYVDFGQTPDEEVVQLLDEAAELTGQGKEAD
ncbi:MAG: phosphoribosyltransferase family protein [Thalassovita sp.]|nr:phosphoribosyltransferase family protein [Thalassovita sp.]